MPPPFSADKTVAFPGLNWLDRMAMNEVGIYRFDDPEKGVKYYPSVYAPKGPIKELGATPGSDAGSAKITETGLTRRCPLPHTSLATS